MEAAPPRRVIGSRMVRYSSVTSTNDIARELASRRADEGTVVVAAEQTLGRGSRGRRWISPKGANLLMSAILRPPIESGRTPELAFVAAVAVARFLVDLAGLPARVKWPNDVRVKGNKISGVLIEAPAVHGDVPPVAIVGVGVNVNWADIPPELGATSVLLETGRETDLEAALAALLDSLDAVYAVYRQDGFEAILRKWRSLDCLAGNQVEVALDGETIQGIAEGVDDNGSLVVRLEDGNLRNVWAGLVVDSPILSKERQIL